MSGVIVEGGTTYQGWPADAFVDQRVQLRAECNDGRHNDIRDFMKVGFNIGS
jgi:hypothetical protein